MFNKQLIKLFIFLSLVCYGHNLFAADLMEVYRQAFMADQIFHQTLSQQMANKQGVPISLSYLLPNLSATLTPTLKKNSVRGAPQVAGDNSQRGYQANLTLTQTIFNFSQFANYAQSISLSKQAHALMNNAIQNLIIRVARAYFNVLHAEDNLRYNEANKAAYAKQLSQVMQQYKVGLKTITDVYTAKAAYESAIASYIAAQTLLANEKENLRVMTGIYYSKLAHLSEDFPLMSPVPQHVETWVHQAERCNWNIQAARYAAEAACRNVKQQFGGHLPSLQVQGIYSASKSKQVGALLDISEIDPAGIQSQGMTYQKSYNASLILNIPIFQGGYVTSSTQQAKYQYQAAYENLIQQIRTTVNQTRQSFLGVLSGISQVKADRQAILAGKSSLAGLRAGYEVGTQTLVDVLNQQQRLFLAYQQYAQDRYAYINNMLALKYAAGTLSPCDLAEINQWLSNENSNENSKVY